MRLELRQFGIRVSLIEPGYIKTEFTATTMGLLRKYTADATSPYARALELAGKAEESLGGLAVGPESVARAIERAAFSRWPRARYVAPFYNALGPILMALLPAWLTDAVLRRAAGLSPGAEPARLPATAG
jgi:short-subunit dehydrogenase